MSKLFITGVTGFLGGAVLEKILNSNKHRDILLLVRASDSQYALERVKENMRKFNVSEEKLQRLHPSQILLGDLASPDAFIDDPRLDQVTHVINCAAVASFSDNPLIWKVNVEGTLALVARMNNVSGLQRFLHVGTAMSSTPERGMHVVEESARLNEGSKHLVKYTHSKSTIECLIRQYYPDFPLLIARPSIVVGHTIHGCKPSSSIFWVFRMGLMLERFMCSLEDKIDVIPVDYCADALLMLLESRLNNGEVVHISAGTDCSATFADIDKAIAKALKQEPVAEKYSQVEYETLVSMRHELKSIFGKCNERLMLKAMRLYGSFASLNVCFSNDKLLKAGMRTPPVFTDYIDRCVKTTLGKTIPEQMVVDFK